PDRQEPGPKPALAPEPAHGAEGSNERLLHQIVEVRLGRARAGEKTCQRTGVATDQFGRGLLVTALPGGNQRRIGRNRGDGLGLGHGAPEGGRGNDANIKWWRLWRLWRSVEPFPTPPSSTTFATSTTLELTRASPLLKSSNKRSNPMRPYDERLEHLLARAAKVFAEKGYHSTTMRDLAAASGMSLAGMYYYVRGKAELLALVQERCFTRVLAGAEQAVAGATEPVERLQLFIRHHVTFFAANLAEMKVLSHEASSLTGERQRKVNVIKRRYVDLLESLLKDVAPDEPQVDRSAAAYALFGMMNWIYNWYDPADEIDPDRLAGLIARIFVGGFAEARSTVQGG